MNLPQLAGATTQTSSTQASPTLRRTETVWPSMCGRTSLVAARVGDWTWDAVAKCCGAEVLCAQNAEGEPTYLSFCYIRMRGDSELHPLTPTFGDRLDAASRVFAVGSESVLTVHRIRLGDGALDGDRWIDDAEFVTPHCGTLLVESYNRWISRSAPGTNLDLRRSSPTTFSTRHLAPAPDAAAPRLRLQLARERLTFREPQPGGRPLGPVLHRRYRIDSARDLNGVGLLYFASYFSIVDSAVARLWRREGRDDGDFPRRVVLDSQLGYLGNADSGGEVDIAVRRWTVPGADAVSAVDVVIRAASDQRVLAVSTTQCLEGPSA